MVCVFKARINPQFDRAPNLKGMAGFKKQTELYPHKNRSKIKVEPHQPSALIVYPTQMYDLLRIYIRFA